MFRLLILCGLLGLLAASAQASPLFLSLLPGGHLRVSDDAPRVAKEARRGGQSSRPVIAPPPMERPMDSVEGGGTDILPPEDSGHHGNDVETPLERRRRLEEAGIVAPPPERKRILSSWEKVGEALLPETQDAAGEPLPIGLRMDANFGSWMAVKVPKQTRYVPDFSYGFSMLFPLGMPSKDANGSSLAYFLGPSAVFYNGGTFQLHKNAYGGFSDVYADTNVTEAGVDLLLAQETSLSRFGVISAEARLSYAPLRQVRAVYDTQTQPPGRSEVGSHTRLNANGLGIGVSGVFLLARTVGVGLFASASLASPPQAKVRVGLQVVLASTRPGATQPLSPPQADPKKPSQELKGTRFDNPVEEKP